MRPHRLQGVLSFYFAEVIKIIRVPNVPSRCAIVKSFSNFCIVLEIMFYLMEHSFQTTCLTKSKCKCDIQVGLLFTEPQFANSVIYFKVYVCLDVAKCNTCWYTGVLSSRVVLGESSVICASIYERYQLHNYCETLYEHCTSLFTILSDWVFNIEQIFI